MNYSDWTKSLINTLTTFLSRFQTKILTDLQKSLRKHPTSPSNKINKRQIFGKTTFLENYFFKSRHHMAPQADPQRAK